VQSHGRKTDFTRPRSMIESNESESACGDGGHLAT
jgi:hypothetical protein